MAEEIRRRKTSDPEMDAMLVIAQAMEPLDRPAADRVLTWATERYVKPDWRNGLDLDTTKALTGFMNGVGELARKLQMDDGSLIRILERVAAEGEKDKDEASVPA